MEPHKFALGHWIDASCCPEKYNWPNLKKLPQKISVVVNWGLLEFFENQILQNTIVYVIKNRL